MCGIAGFIGNKELNSGIIQNTLALMNNRGPDANNYVQIKEDSANIYLLHSRLSILDLDPRSNQPFTKEHTTIVFNGEIYNYIELKTDLIKKGIALKTNSDTEILLTYYLIYGENCVEYFEGMWAFAIYDHKKKKLFLSRDRFAEKPLYYTTTNDGLYFASETRFLKSLCQKKFDVNHQQIFRYLVNGHKSLYKTGDTFYTDIKELPFANNLTISLELEKEESTYWKPTFTPQKMTMQEAIQGTRERLIHSMKIRLRSDVPLAFCLSGGIDSASLASIAAKELNYNVATFSIIDRDKRYDESDNIQATVSDLGCKNIMIKLSPKDNHLERLKSLISYHDAPVATISYLVHSYLSEAISQHGYKIAISGTGADELFTGYYDHFNLHLYEMRNHSNYNTLLKDWGNFVKQYVRHPFFQKPDLYFKNPEIREHIYLNNNEFASFLKTDFKETFTEKRYSSSLLRNRMLNELFHEVVRVILHEDDLNSMQYSVENRSPFLDTGLFNFAYSIPNELLIKDGYAKYILRESVKGILNEKVRLSREKRGFNADINSIIDLNNKSHTEILLSNSSIFDIVNREKIEQLLKKGNYSNSYKKFLFNFINAKIFLG